jgi:SAM-dependent methyltransferase
MSTTIDVALSRREFMKRALGLMVLLGAAPRVLGESLAGMAADALKDDPGNFRAIYLDAALRDEFFLFLQNVFHLYPEAEFHQLIVDLVKKDSTDESVYRALLQKLPALKPAFGDFTYALPALTKQKDELARQALVFLGPDPGVNGYLEIGSPGRYISELRRRIRLTGPVHLIHDSAPSYSASDIMERGGLAKIGTYHPLGDYDPFVGPIAENSLDLVNNFIGFHHCPADRLEGFVASIHKVLRPGGRLLLRDHDVDRASRWSMVALAHDVFNAGLLISWEDTHHQVRLFRSMRDWTDYLTAKGFKRSERLVAQDHDPTKNLLSEFVKKA